MGAKRIATAFVAVLALGAMSSGAVLPGAAAAKEEKAKTGDPSKRVCKNIVRAGTRLGTRVCRTQQQWDDAQEKTQEGVLEHQMGPGTTRASPGFPGQPG